MKRVITFLFFLVISAKLFAQQEYFVFIQSENNQLFYIKFGVKIFSSSAIGHVIIPALRDSTYTLELGFPKDQFAGQIFIININKKDYSFQLKNIGEEGWVLMNLLNHQLLRSKHRKNGSAIPAGEPRKDGYSALMAGVVDDSSVLYTSISRIDRSVHQNHVLIADSSKTQELVGTEVEKKAPLVVKEKEMPSKKSDSGNNKLTEEKPFDISVPINTNVGAKTINDSANTTVKIDNYQDTVAKVDSKSLAETANQTGKKFKGKGSKKPSIDSSLAKTGIKKQGDTLPVKPSAVRKLIERNTTSGAQLVFVDKINSRKTDTIRMFIPFEKEEAFEISANKNETKTTTAPKTDADVSQKIDPDTSSRKIRQKIINRSDTINTNSSKIESAGADSKPVVMINSDCRNFASENDVDKLRVKMLSEKSEEDRVSVARKVFKTKCFTTKQIKALSELFAKDEGKYMFFDAAYPFVTDTESFRQLVHLLSEDYWVNRFKAMMRK